jgi:hypothetical protein
MRSILLFFFHSETNIETTRKKRSELRFPWWCLFIAYGLSLIVGGISIFFIIVRGIEFGDLKTQKWLTSLLTGLLSSIFLIQPTKVDSFIQQKKRFSMNNFV